MKVKKANPRARPASQADVDRAYKRGQNEALEMVLYVVLYVLMDKHGADKEKIQSIRDDLMYTIDSIAKKYVKWQDIRQVMDEEYDVHLELK